MTDSPTPRQPWISDLSIGVRGNVTTLAHRSGDVGGGATGVYIDDRRLVSRLALSIGDSDLVPVAAEGAGPVTMSIAVARHLGDRGPDPTVTVRRTREIRSWGVEDEIAVESRAAEVVEAEVRLEIASDGVDLSDIKGGRVEGEGRPPSRLWSGGVVWTDDRHEIEIELEPRPYSLAEAGGVVTARWSISVARGERVVLFVRGRSSRRAPSDFDANAGTSALAMDHVLVQADDDRLERLCVTSAADVKGLLLTDPLEPDDCFAAAGSPWYLTLFGRDSIWAARFALPFGSELAGGTLRTLARRQGRHHDVDSAQEPGKILHEVRRTVFADPSSPMRLPPVYYGTVDATPLWVVLLHEAWTWGLPDEQVRELLPHLLQAMSWIERTERDGDGLLRYEDVTGVGLSNQGWKDSGDSMRRRDGSIAPAPIALVETMAYAAQAARAAVALVAAFGAEVDSDLTTRWSELGDRLEATIRQRFWVSDDIGPYLAMAIDGDGRHVDGVGSNMGHVLGTGVLTANEASSVASRLVHPTMLRDFGIATLSTDNPGYNPIGYHSGSVWVHDTAICALGLAREGFATEAMAVLRRIIDLASRVGYRLPELLSGEAVLGSPVPYPASCRPQAWAAAAGLALVPALLGLTPDAAHGVLRINPLDPLSTGRLSVEGLRVGPHRISVSVTPDGRVRTNEPSALRIVTGPDDVSEWMPSSTGG